VIRNSKHNLTVLLYSDLVTLDKLALASKNAYLGVKLWKLQ